MGKEPLNIIGHSYGAHTANKVAKNMEGQVDALVGVDPVAKPNLAGRGPPENVDKVVTVTATPDQRDASDAVETAGRAIGGIPGAFETNVDTEIEVEANHAEPESNTPRPVRTDKAPRASWTRAMRRRSSRDGMHRHASVRVGLVILAVVLCPAVGCSPHLLLSPEVIGTSDRGPAEMKAVHPTQREDVRAIWTEVTDQGPFLVVRVETDTDLQSLADRRHVSYVRYKAYACSDNPDWLAEITSGPVFAAREPDPDLDRSRLYDIYLPIDLSAAIESRRGAHFGVDLGDEVRKAEENGLCIVLLGPKPYGRGFSSRLTRVPASISDGKIEAAGSASFSHEAAVISAHIRRGFGPT